MKVGEGEAGRVAGEADPHVLVNVASDARKAGGRHLLQEPGVGKGRRQIKAKNWRKKRYDDFVNIFGDAKSKIEFFFVSFQSWSAAGFTFSRNPPVVSIIK